MPINLFGLNNSEKKKPKVNCKSKFEIEKLTIKISKDLNQNNSELFFSFQLSFKKGQIAFSVLEAFLINKNNQTQQIYIHLTHNENTNYFNGSITLNNSEATNCMLNKIKIKIVNLCNDTTVFRLKNKDNLELNNHEVAIENEKINLI
jgi:hypothetical protein